jgi:hypothetical protein
VHSIFKTSVKDDNVWQYNRYGGCDAKVTTQLRKIKPRGGTTITSDVAEMAGLNPDKKASQ